MINKTFSNNKIKWWCSSNNNNNNNKIKCLCPIHINNNSSFKEVKEWIIFPECQIKVLLILCLKRKILCWINNNSLNLSKIFSSETMINFSKWGINFKMDFREINWICKCNLINKILKLMKLVVIKEVIPRWTKE